MTTDNWATEVARRFHEETKHSYESLRRSPVRLDLSNWPYPFKDYLTLEPLRVPDDLADLLRWGAGTVRSRTLSGGQTYHFRTYSSAGGLYPIELYVATPEGLHHFHPHELALRRLRGEDVRGAAGVPAATVLFLSGILWRTAWKYRERGYRHLYWDTGTMLANLLALSASAGLQARLLIGFVDVELDTLLGIDGTSESTLAVLALGADEPPPLGRPGPLELEVAPLSRAPIRYPLAEETHDASRLRNEAELVRFRAGAPSERADAGPALADRLEPVLRRRVSIRDFTPEPVPADDLVEVLSTALAPIPADTEMLVRLCLIASAVEGLEAGIHDFDPPDRFELVRGGELRRLAGYLVLEQDLGARAAAVVFAMADLEHALSTLGNRGYRAAQLQAGIVCGRLQVLAFARGWGATCSTFYDDDVTDAVAPIRRDSPMLCVALGRR